MLERLSSGYPRFVIHPLVGELGRRAGEGRPCLPFPSARAAAAGAEFVRRCSGEEACAVGQKGMHAVVTGPSGLAALRAFWQHTGLGVSSRQAQARLEGRAAANGADDPAVRRALRRFLAALYDCGEDDVFLEPTGMAAQFAALCAADRRAPGRPTAQLGFPYVDTLKLQQKLGNGGILLNHLEDIENELRGPAAQPAAGGLFLRDPGQSVARLGRPAPRPPHSAAAPRPAGGR